MAQNKIAIAFLSIATLIAVAAAIIFSVGYATEAQATEEIQQKYDNVVQIMQVDQDALMLIDDWYKEDGYDDAIKWWADYREDREFLSNIKEKVETGENSSYATTEQLDRLSAMESEAKETRSVKKLKDLRTEFDSIVQAIADQRTAAENAPVETTYNYDYSYTPSSSYNVPSDGLTPQSGVNYHDGRTETYYSSNVLYHHDTGNWTVDSEGFYRTDEGYYVVAASDMAQGTTFETSKGTAVVLDSGCSNGVTDFYVNW